MIPLHLDISSPFWLHSLSAVAPTNTSLLIKKYNSQHLETPQQFKSTPVAKDKKNIFTITNQQLLMQIPAIVDWKDCNHRFLGCNIEWLTLGGLKKTNDIIGKHAIDFSFGANGYAKIFEEQDNNVLQGESRLFLGRYAFNDEEKTMLVKKIPIHCAKEVIGMMNYLIPLPHPSAVNILSHIRKLGICIDETLINQINTYMENNGSIYSKFTNREQECIYLLLRGASIKDIAKLLAISPRTIEVYFNNIKDKMQCVKKSLLITKLISQGYLNLIPTHLLKKLFIN